MENNANHTPLAAANPQDLLPMIQELYCMVYRSQDPKERVVIAQKTAALRTKINKLSESIESLEGGDLSISDQENLIQILQTELQKRQQQE